MPGPAHHEICPHIDQRYGALLQTGQQAMADAAPLAHERQKELDDPSKHRCDKILELMVGDSWRIEQSDDAQKQQGGDGDGGSAQAWRAGRAVDSLSAV